MAFYDEDDLDVFFDTDDFAVSATSGTLTFPVLFDNESEIYDSYTGQVVTTSPVMRCKTSDIATLKKGDTVTIGGVSYKIITPPKPDGTGITLFGLQEA